MSADRSVNVARHRRVGLPSLKAAVDSGDVMAGCGPGSPNCAPLCTTRGVTEPIHGTNIARFAGGVGRQIPGPGVGANVIFALRPSFARRAMIALAARIPKAIPLALAGLLRIDASADAYAASKFVWAYGEYVSRTWCAAAATAASSEVFACTRAWRPYGWYRPWIPTTASYIAMLRNARYRKCSCGFFVVSPRSVAWATRFQWAMTSGFPR